MLDFSQARNQLEELATELLRYDLANNGQSRVYIVLGSDLDFPVKRFGSAFEPNLSTILRDDIGSRWQGPGPTILIATENLVGPLNHAQFGVGAFVNRIISGLACAVVSPSMFPNSDQHDTRDDLREYAGVDEADDDHQSLMARDHIRTWLHLRSRFASFNWRCPLGDMKPWSDALGDEPERYFTVPLTKLIRHAPPQAFTELYAFNERKMKWGDE